MQKSDCSNRVTYMQITSKCNATCIMCDIWKQQPKDMDLSVIIEQLNKVEESSPCSEIRLTGGEPCMHEQFSQIIDEIEKRNLRKSVITNGSLFSYNNIESMNFSRIFISIDSPIKKDQKKIRGLELNFSTEHDLNVIASVIISKKNKTVIPKIPGWLAQNNIKHINIIPMKDVRYSLPTEEFMEILNQLIISCKANNINHFAEGNEYSNGIDMDIVYEKLNNFNPIKKCEIQNIVRFITLNGEIYNCNSTPHRSYSIFNRETASCIKCHAYMSNYCDFSNILYNSLVQ